MDVKKILERRLDSLEKLEKEVTELEEDLKQVFPFPQFKICGKIIAMKALIAREKAILHNYVELVNEGGDKNE